MDDTSGYSGQDCHPKPASLEHQANGFENHRSMKEQTDLLAKTKKEAAFWEESPDWGVGKV